MAISETAKLLEIVKAILDAAPRKEMHITEIVDKAIALNQNLGLSKEVLTKKLSSILAANAKSKTNPIVNKVKNPKTQKERRGFYKLKRTATGPTHKITCALPSVSSLYIGAAGEYSVTSELLFWGFNVAKPMVDTGIDLICEKGNSRHYVQVKTCLLKDANATSFSFKIEEKVFEACSNKDPWYVFVMRAGPETNYAIIPNQQLQLWRKIGKITGKDLSIIITRNEKKDQYRLGDTDDINPFINNFKIMDGIL